MTSHQHPTPAGLKRTLPALALLTLTACSGDQPDGGGMGMGGDMPPTPVTTTTLETANITYYGDYPARLRGMREVSIRPQVAGILEELRFTEGQPVEAGQTLFKIDPEPFQLMVNAARADLQTAQAEQQQAQREWERVAGLFEEDAASQRERDSALAAREAADARVAQAESNLADANRNLRYTRVESPVAGVTGMETVSEGNLIETGTELTQVTQTDPIRVHFALPAADARQRRQAQEAADSAERYQEAWLQLGQNSEYPEAGTINFQDSRVEATSGSVAMRAEFANPDGQLVPGAFQRIRLVLQEYQDIVLIDPSAVSQGPEGPQVFIADGATAQARPVTLGPEIDGQQVITAGLEPGDELIVNGHVALRDGADIDVTNNGDQEG